MSSVVGKGRTANVIRTQSQALLRQHAEERLAQLESRHTERLDVRRVLGTVPLFSTMDAATLDLVQDQATHVNYAKGDWIVQEGDASDFMIVLLSGRAQVIKDGDVVADLKMGGLVGELTVMALIAGRIMPGNANVVSRAGGGTKKEDGEGVFGELVRRSASVRVTSARARCLHVAAEDFLANDSVRQSIFGDSVPIPPPPALSSSDDESPASGKEREPFIRDYRKGASSWSKKSAVSAQIQVSSKALQRRQKERRALQFAQSTVVSSTEPMRLLYEPINTTVLRDAGWNAATTKGRNLIQVLCEMKDQRGCEILRT
eukprot:COSAG01_NODE_572_length_15298_cov_8.549172_22_plen_317_part_00